MSPTTAQITGAVVTTPRNQASPIDRMSGLVLALMLAALVAPPIPASDAAGFAGLADSVDFHGGSLLKGVALSTVLGVGTQLSLGTGESDLVQAIRESAQQRGARAGDRLVEKQLDVEPTITVRPGWPVRVVVHKDLVLKPWRR